MLYFIELYHPVKTQIMSTIKVVIRKDKVSKDGLAPLYIRIIKDRKPRLISLGIKLKPTEWDEDLQRVKKSNKNSSRLNALISQKIADANAEVVEIERTKKTTTSKRLKEAILGKEPTHFFTFGFERCEAIKNTVSVSTYRNYKMYLEKFKIFIGSDDLFFEDITPQLLSDYIKYCTNTLGNSKNTVHYSINILAIFFKDAIRAQVITNANYPFTNITVKKKPGERLYLNAAQLKSFEEFEPSSIGTAPIFKDMFLFAVYGGGLRFGDVVSLQWKNYDEENHKISVVVGKTKRQHSIKLGDKSVEILHKYHTELTTQEDFIFPLIKNREVFFKNKDYHSREITRTNALSSLHLKKIGKELKFPFSLTFHISRHTFATRVLNNGMRIEHVSKILDHSDIGVTQI